MEKEKSQKNGLDFDMEEINLSEDNQKRSEKHSYMMEYYSATVVCLSMYSAVYGYHWIGPILLKFTRPETYIEISSSQAMLLSSMYQIANMPSELLSPFLNDRFGRRNTLAFSAIPIIFAQCILIYKWPTINTLYISRFFTGLGAGIAYASLNVYLSEISSANIRGMIGTFSVVMTCIAEIALFIVVPLTTVTQGCILATIPPILLLGLSFTIPESPYYYIMRNRDHEGKQCLQKLRSGRNVDEELSKISEYVHSSEANKSIKTIWTEPVNRRSLFVIILVFFTQTMTGYCGVSTYGQVLMDEAPTFVSAENGGILATVAHVITVLITCLLIDRCGRRPLLFWSTITSIAPLLMIAFYFFCKQFDFMIYESISWFPFLGYLGYKVTSTFGLTAVAHIYTSEIFPTYLRAFAVGLGSAVGAVWCMVSLVIHTKMTDNLGNWQIFVFYSFICMFGGTLMHFYLPETKCQTLEDIQDMLRNKTEIIDKPSEKFLS